ncbi:helix-turn-helix transcriptional regulator [Pseudoalteromonas sp. T1lg122]|uniref:helix-turn-helix transcriptional regulator n=1 Tax=Pseudoalteromonas sp. T1lg122 TaxID=2077094 RepID=UPI000CF650F7|nr:AlpA family transcriptional regulator [Pseudoalteromonas sp. T1lg122]
MSETYLSINKILKRYSFSRTTFFKLRKNGGFPHPVTPKNFSPRWSLEVLQNWENKNMHSQISEFGGTEA